MSFPMRFLLRARDPFQTARKWLNFVKGLKLGNSLPNTFSKANKLLHAENRHNFCECAVEINLEEFVLLNIKIRSHERDRSVTRMKLIDLRGNNTCLAFK